jgi:hypothetical protein
MSTATGLARSLQVRLARHARAIDADPNLVLARCRREAPLALAPAFADVEGKRAQWAAFLAKNRIAGAPEDFAIVIADLARFVLPVMRAARRVDRFAGRWAPGGPWR